jgi:16S rRNA (adenine1518-N6/adenine1519-N6)-dimethyltransferase
MGGRTYQVVANIPYYITSAVIRHLLNAANKPSSMVLTIQKEVAERLCAKPGNLSLLALSVQIFGTPELVFTIPAEAFTPQPKVDSAVVRIELFAEPKVADAQQDDFFKLIKAGFGQKRKTLRNALAANLKEPAVQVGQQLRQVEIDPMRRAETLSIEEWLRLLEHRS